MSTDMKLPELGENIEGGDVLRVMVKPGDAITKDQPVLELETDKATIEVPSSAAGVVKEIKVKPGEKVKVGQTIFTVDENGAGAAPAKEQGQPPTGDEQPVSAAAVAPKPAAPESAKAEVKAEKAEKAEKRKAEVVEMKPPKQAAPAPAPAAADSASIPAAPSARRLARELGVHIAEIQGSGSGGRISLDDVTAFARRLLSGAATGVGRAGGAAAEALPDFSKWGSIERKPMTGVRRTTAHRLTHAWNTIPHVFQQDRADITSVETLRKRLSKKAEAEGRSPITITAFLMKTLAAALKKFPQLNASADMQSDEIIFKHYAHIGVAVDTDRGLLVPVIRDVDEKDIFQIADETANAAEKARNRKLSLDDMQGASITISNLGSLGGGAFTPIVNWPEVAILGVARARMEPVYADGEFVPRFLMPLTLSYDHRVVDGADGVRILRWIVEAVEQPALIWLDT
ncbi:MAG: branched-chain alpha-keto acid dehydrogenase subunit E2 [Acidobacteria bacterium]|nr:MAG: branched-chain alpha-keto acid dehydrogenase subunit E2 [Acidobacteriota bacterium]